jgi:outer membrane lipoprotein LolB
MMRQVFLVLLAGAVASLIAGCASLPPPPPQTSLSRETSAEAFSFSGRIALRQQDRNLSGGIRWQHSVERDDILLLSPLGQGVMSIARDAVGATLRTPDDKTYHAPDAEQLAFEVTGWRIPVSGLASWVRGNPRPGPVVREQRDDQGRLASLTQDEWTIEYPVYFDPPNERLPKRMVLTRPEFELKLVVDNWEHAPAAENAPAH